MKKIIIVLVILASGILTACGIKKEKTTPTKSSPELTTTIEKSSTSKSSEEPIASESIVSSSETVKTEDVQGSNLTQARLKLYQAGIDSSSISDEQLLKYWDEAKKEKIDFVKYVQDKL